MEFKSNIEQNSYVREKGRDLTQSFDKSPKKHPRKNQKSNETTTKKRHQNIRIHNDCGPT